MSCNIKLTRSYFNCIVVNVIIALIILVKPLPAAQPSKDPRLVQYSNQVFNHIKKIGSELKMNDAEPGLNALVKITIRKDGTVTNISVNKLPSGTRFEKLIEKSIKASEPFPVIPDDIQKSEITLQFNFSSPKISLAQLKNKIPTRSDLDAALPYAELSAAIYSCGDKCEKYNGKSGNWYPILDSRDLLNKLEGSPDEPMGFRAVAYTTSNKDRLAIIYEGSSLISIADWVTNLAQPVWSPPQFIWALTFAKAALGLYCENDKNCRSRVVLAGHSLGGGLAQYVALNLGTRAFTFNPSGLWPGTIQEIDMTYIKEAQIKHFSSKGYLFGKLAFKDLVPMTGLQFSQEAFEIPIDLPLTFGIPNPTQAILIEKFVHNMERLRDQMFEMRDEIPVFGGGTGGSWGTVSDDDWRNISGGICSPVGKEMPFTKKMTDKEMPLLKPINGQGLLIGRIIDNFNQPVSGVSVKIYGSNLEVETDREGKYQLPYVPGQIRVIVSHDGYDPHEFNLNLTTSSTYPVEDKRIVKEPPGNGIYAVGAEDWLALSKCTIVQTEVDSGDISKDGANRFGVRGTPCQIITDKSPYFLDATNSEYGLLLYRVLKDGTIINVKRESGLSGAMGLVSNDGPGGTPIKILHGTVKGNDRPIYGGELTPGIYAFVQKPFGPIKVVYPTDTCYLFEYKPLGDSASVNALSPPVTSNSTPNNATSSSIQPSTVSTEPPSKKSLGEVAENDKIKPVQLEREVSLMGIKIGTSFEESIKIMKERLQPAQDDQNPQISEQGREESEFWPGNQYREVHGEVNGEQYKSRLEVNYTVKSLGSQVYSVDYYYEMPESGKVLLENLMNDLQKKYGKQSPPAVKGYSVFPVAIWYFDQNGKIQPFPCGGSEQCYSHVNLANPNSLCIGKYIIASFWAERYLIIQIIDYDFYHANKKRESEIKKTIAEQKQKQSLENAQKNRISF